MKKFGLPKRQMLKPWASVAVINNSSNLSTISSTALLGGAPRCMFAKEREFTWAQKDLLELKSIDRELILHKQYKKLRDLWQKPLARKDAARERKAERPSLKVEDNDLEKLVIHNPSKDVNLDPASDEMFAIFRLGNQQYKVTQNDLIQSEQVKEDIGTQLCFEEVFCVGTTDYSAVGRPIIASARVFATLEQHEKTEKVIVFKKRRRKGYQKNQGHRQLVTLLRIDQIEYVPSEEVINQARPLVADPAGNAIDVDSIVNKPATPL